MDDGPAGSLLRGAEEADGLAWRTTSEERELVEKYVPVSGNGRQAEAVGRIEGHELPNLAGGQVAHAGGTVAKGEQVLAGQPAVRRPVGEEWDARGAGQQGARLDATVRLDDQPACALPGTGPSALVTSTSPEEATSSRCTELPQLRRSL